jgi:hypothetical protein
MRIREFTSDEVQSVWDKGNVVSGQNQVEWRKDACGAWIGRSFYGDRKSDYGWEVDHIDPNGGDSLSNLQPLQWKNNVSKSDGSLDCTMKAEGVKNVPV